MLIVGVICRWRRESLIPSSVVVTIVLFGSYNANILVETLPYELMHVSE